MCYLAVSLETDSSQLMLEEQVMSGSDVILNVSAADQAAEVFVIDGRFRVLAHGIGQVELSVPPGIYRGPDAAGRTRNHCLF